MDAGANLISRAQNLYNILPGREDYSPPGGGVYYSPLVCANE
jgi:hypothetical protein